MEKNEITPDIAKKMLLNLIDRGIKATSNNLLIQLEDGYISFNPNTDTGKETAVVKNRKFFILLGDHRESLKGCKTFYEACKVFKELIKNGAEVSIWSDYK